MFEVCVGVKVDILFRIHSGGCFGFSTITWRIKLLTAFFKNHKDLYTFLCLN